MSDLVEELAGDLAQQRVATGTVKENRTDQWKNKAMSVGELVQLIRLFFLLLLFLSSCLTVPVLRSEQDRWHADLLKAHEEGARETLQFRAIVAFGQLAIFAAGKRWRKLLGICKRDKNKQKNESCVEEVSASESIGTKTGRGLFLFPRDAPPTASNLSALNRASGTMDAGSIICDASSSRRMG